MSTATDSICPQGVLCVSPWAIVCGFVIVGLCVYIYILHQRQHNNVSVTTQHAANHTKHAKQDHIEQQPTQHLSTHTRPSHPQLITQQESVTDMLVTESAQHTSALPPTTQYTTNVFTNSHENNMLRPPLRHSPGTTRMGLMPINIETRGETPEMQQVGILRSKTNDKVLALYGRPTYRGSSKWIYYTGTDKYHSIKLPVEKNNKDCTAEYGCDELYDDDEVQVKGYEGSFQTSIYQLDAPRYIPFVA